MPISWNEIRQNAIAFSRDWKDETREEAEAKTFWDEFFQVFGLKRRTVASFEEPVKKLSGTWGFIDLFWKGKVLVEHKSRGKSLEKAETQAMEYIQGLQNAKRNDEIPRYVVVSDFARFALHDLDESQTLTFNLEDFHKHIDKFAFIPGYETHKLETEDPVNIEAVERLGRLHDALQEGGYSGHDLEQFLVRILFCLFAEDTGIFEASSFALSIENHTKEDGSDLGTHIARVFQILNTPEEKRQKNLPEDLATFPYVNGHLFKEALPFAEFNRKMRDELLHCSRFDWSQISPAVFGSLFQSVMEPKERRQAGAHYTSERDILKLVRSLFLDDLKAEFEKVKSNKNRLRAFHDKLGGLTFFDPACGCGNFLVVTYRELRLLELEVLKLLLEEDRKRGQRAFDLSLLSRVDVDSMHGIEINEFPARIAEVALWLVDHQMNLTFSKEFGEYFVRLPLKKSAKIVHGNALRLDWKEVIPPERCSYILGNPPFVGKHLMSDEQSADMDAVWRGVKGSGLLDLVTGWYLKAADFVKGTQTPVAFVSTNSITQGEQVGVLWTELFKKEMKIHFAHRTFSWQSEARGKAHVHVVIIGFGPMDTPNKRIYDYETDEDNPTITPAKNISPYLVEGNDLALTARTKPICQVPAIINGNKPTDDGNLIVEDSVKEQFLTANPTISPYLKPFLSASEYLNNKRRWVLWLKDAPPEILKENAGVLERLAKVKEFRLASPKKTTIEMAEFPSLFDEIRQPETPYLVIPRHSSETRKYIPIGYFTPETIISDGCTAIPNAGNYEFGIVTSRMHMAWMSLVCGRIKSDYRYSNKLVYNNFAWPESPTDKQKANVEAKAQAVLDARAEHPNTSLADLYDPLTMPPNLSKAHNELDRAVELCYRPKAFTSDRERVEFLFELYEKITSPLTAQVEAETKPKRTRKKKGEATPPESE